jgi:hypothetical protein
VGLRLSFSQRSRTDVSELHTYRLWFRAGQFRIDLQSTQRSVPRVGRIGFSAISFRSQLQHFQTSHLFGLFLDTSHSNIKSLASTLSLRSSNDEGDAFRSASAEQSNDF